MTPRPIESTTQWPHWIVDAINANDLAVGHILWASQDGNGPVTVCVSYTAGAVYHRHEITFDRTAYDPNWQPTIRSAR